MKNYYIYTEIVNCGKIGKIAIDSFHKYHNYKIHIYGTKEDFKWIEKNDNNIFIEVNHHIIDGYKSGHIGTALLWEDIIKNCPDDYLIHFDSDVIFRENIIGDMIEKSKEYDLIGPIRNYTNNPYGFKKVSGQTDLCQTNIFLFNKKKISNKYIKETSRFLFIPFKKIIKLTLKEFLRRIKWFIKNNIILQKYNMNVFTQMIHGTYNPFTFPTIDFFDPVMFDMVMNGAKIYHLDFNEVGGCDYYGKRDNQYKEINNFPTPYKLDFGSKLVHFSCVGSGMNFYNNKNATLNVGKNYVECALDRYALYCKIFYNEQIPDIELGKYKEILEIKNWY